MGLKEYDQFVLEIQSDNTIKATLDTLDNLKSFGTAKVVDDEYLRTDIRESINKLKLNQLDGQAEDIQRLGRDLYRAIFPNEVETLFESALKKVINDRRYKNRSRWLRVVIDVHPKSEVFFWPLEFLYCGSLGYWLAKEKPMIALSRRITFGGKSGTIDLNPQGPPLRLLVIISKPKDEELGGVITTKVLEEIGMLAEAKFGDEDSEDIKRMDVKVLGQVEGYEKKIKGIDYLDQPATFAKITELVNDLGPKDELPHVLHFIGHGKLEQEGFLGLLNNGGLVDWCRAEDISNLFKDWYPRLILLQACEGAKKDPAPGLISLADQLIQRSIPAVVAMQLSITNNYATMFATGFYEALRDGKDVDEAVQNGRWKMWNADRGQKHHFGTPVLITYDPKGIILIQERERPGTPGRSRDKTSYHQSTATPVTGLELIRRAIEKALSWLGDDGHEVNKGQAEIWMKQAQKNLEQEQLFETLEFVHDATLLMNDLDSARRSLENALRNLEKRRIGEQLQRRAPESISAEQEQPSGSRLQLWQPQSIRALNRSISHPSR